MGRTAANGVKHLAILEGLVDIDGADVGDNVAHAAAETGTDGYIAEARLTVAVDEIDNSLHLGRDRLANKIEVLVRNIERRALYGRLGNDHAHARPRLYFVNIGENVVGIRDV